jgi:hypothetical protein
MIVDDQDAVPEFPAGHTVLALYPSTTCFYKAVVVQPPSKVNPQDQCIFARRPMTTVSGRMSDHFNLVIDIAE